jgi:hypothetical protein
VFQLAHCVGEADFPLPVVSATGGERHGNGLGVHQVADTVDFARRNRSSRGCWVVELPDRAPPPEQDLPRALPAALEDRGTTCHDFACDTRPTTVFFSALSSHYRCWCEWAAPRHDGNALTSPSIFRATKSQSACVFVESRPSPYAIRRASPGGKSVLSRWRGVQIDRQHVEDDRDHSGASDKARACSATSYRMP